MTFTKEGLEQNSSEKSALFEQDAERNGPDANSLRHQGTVDIDKTYNLTLPLQDSIGTVDYG